MLCSIRVYAVKPEVVQTISMPEFYSLDCKMKGHIDEVSVNYAIEDEECEGTLYVYLPYDYSADKRYDIVYHQCGSGSTDNELMKYADVQNMLDNLIYDNSIEPVIFVIVPDFAYGSTKSFKNHLLEIMSIIESKYHTYTDFDVNEDAFINTSNHRMIAGFSRGAYATWDIIAGENQYADYYMGCSPFYGTWDYESKVIAAAPENDRIVVFNTIGELECEPNYPFDGIEQCVGLQETMNEYGIENYSYIVEGEGHHQRNVMTAYYVALQRVFDKKKQMPLAVQFMLRNVFETLKPEEEHEGELPMAVRYMLRGFLKQYN